MKRIIIIKVKKIYIIYTVLLRATRGSVSLGEPQTCGGGVTHIAEPP